MEPERGCELLAEGRLNQEAHYKRATKELSLQGMRLDQVRREGGRLIISEVKKSSGFLPATRLQLGYYLWRLGKCGIFYSSFTVDSFNPGEHKRTQKGLDKQFSNPS